jgi:uncharacterized membrane protein YwaF
MSYKKIMGLIGVAGSFGISLILIYWKLAEMVAHISGMSQGAAEGFWVTLLVVVSVARAVLILLDRDLITNYIHRNDRADET